MAVASVVLLALVGAVAWLVLRGDTYVAEPDRGVPAAASPDEAARVLGELRQALADGDADAAAALGADDEARSLLAAVARNAAGLRVVDLTLRYVDEVGAVAADGSWQAAVDLAWAFEGFDRDPAHVEVLVGFRSTPDGVAVTGLGGGGDRRTPVWLAGPVTVSRTATTLVLAAGRAPDAASYTRLARAAVPAVRAVLPAWRGRLVVEVPSTQGMLDRALGATEGTYANIAAVTATVDGTVTPQSPVHVFLNPVVFGALDPVGAQVVMTHEVTHLATDAPMTPSVPQWLLEGFADHVALRDTDLPLSLTARQIIEQVRRDGAPRQLPGAAEFDEASTHLGAAYESAWLACVVLADRGGEAALVRLYEETAGGADVEAGLRRGFGLDVAGLTRLWRARLTELAG
ncbi:hypothetical protein [Nocardioides sp. SYSU D00038]|uniref:hypothetical protein n=1 Tax=Nocardioides sp. SYSU D00038 TaxID=2812554 RepID=UPI00196861BE|nr:hypothetical protein [Nocardioides sp. SYSU D00038]